MILDEIAKETKERIEKKKKEVPLYLVRERAENFGNDRSFPFDAALKKPGLSFICEVKKASPSKGVIAEKFPYLEIAREYESAGADAISCLTEPFRFLGRDEYLNEIARLVNIPVLRKDFTVDDYMIYEAKALGASAVLLIAAILDDVQLKEWFALSRELGLSAIMEAHDDKEVERALKAGGNIIGVNNRNLKDFTVDINNSIRLRNMVPKDRIFISESGIRTEEDLKALYANGTDAVLIGETLMRAENRGELLGKLKK
ncbi:MAG: indole-3-glycerol phosphate synthase TrpC [Lachnospiraceae bacterium]|nr:indole-3-glycerol phosphate synthase TrpC [Lachnospiraceae bacterium]